MDSAHHREQPQASRLELPKGYALPSGKVELLSWSYVKGLLGAAHCYWLATTRPDGRPHVTPVWGAWIDGVLYFDGIPTARWARNIAINSSISVYLEIGSDVVILDGLADNLVTNADIAARIRTAWDKKYGRLHPKAAEDGIFRFRPRAARAWRAFPEDVTRWQFGLSETGDG